MSDRFVVESDRRVVGVAVRSPGGFKFFSSDPGLCAAEGRTFARARSLTIAVTRTTGRNAGSNWHLRPRPLDWRMTCWRQPSIHDAACLADEWASLHRTALFTVHECELHYLSTTALSAADDLVAHLLLKKLKLAKKVSNDFRRAGCPDEQRRRV